MKIKLEINRSIVASDVTKSSFKMEALLNGLS
jgi:hypothetical protein